MNVENQVRIIGQKYGEERLAELIRIYDGDSEAAVRVANRHLVRVARAKEQERRRERRAGSAVLYRGPARVSAALAALAASGQKMRAKMSSTKLLRNAALGTIPGYSAEPTNTVVLWDLREGEPAEGSVVLAEIIKTQTGDCRIHLSRLRELREEIADVPVLDFAADVNPDEFTQVCPPLMSPGYHSAVITAESLRGVSGA